MIKPEEPSRKSESWPKVNLSGSGPWLYAKEISASEQWGNNGRRLPQAKVPHLSELQRQLVLGGRVSGQGFLGRGFQGGSLGRSRPVNALTATTSGLIALVRHELEEEQGTGGPGRRTQGPRQVRTVKTDCVAPPAGEPPAPRSSTSTPPVGIVSPTIYTKREKPAGKRTATVTRNRICNWSRSCRSCRTGLGNRRDTKVHRARAGNKKFVFILHKNVFSPEPRGELWPHPQKKQLIYDTRQGHGGEIKKKRGGKGRGGLWAGQKGKGKKCLFLLPASKSNNLS